MADYLWPIIALGCWCFGFTAGIAWAAQFRPTIIRIANRVVVDSDD